MIVYDGHQRHQILDTNLAINVYPRDKVYKSIAAEPMQRHDVTRK